MQAGIAIISVLRVIIQMMALVLHRLETVTNAHLLPAGQETTCITLLSLALLGVVSLTATCNLMKSSTAGRGPLRLSLPSEKPQRMEACYCERFRRLYYEWHGCDNQNFGCSYFESMRVYGRNQSYFQIVSF